MPVPGVIIVRHGVGYSTCEDEWREGMCAETSDLILSIDI